MSNVIEQMRKTLADAGRELPEDASPSEVETAYIELEVERETAEDAAGEAPPIEPELEPPIEVEAETEAFPDQSTTEEALQAVLASADPKAGDKDPKVVEWCRQNLSPEEFAERYAGRNFDA